MNPRTVEIDVTVLAVDLAAKYSAVCLMDEEYTVIREFDSWGITEEMFLYQVVGPWLYARSVAVPDVLVIEDLPHGLAYSTLVKTVCRIQGRIVQAMHESLLGAVEDVLFVAPRQWRSHYEGMQRGTGPEAVFAASEKYEYLPPADLEQRAKGNGGKTKARKVASDYCSAYLIARWAFDMKREYGTFDVPGTSRYDTREIRAKEFHVQDV